MRRRSGRLITIGSFDGVHQGHAALLDWTVKEARERRLKSLALTFEIPPRMILNRHHEVSILSTHLEKSTLIKARGVDEVVSLKFDSRVSSLKPYRFFREVLLERFNAKGIVVGLDFRFGTNRLGGAVDLVRWGQEERIPVWVISQVKWHRQPISSTEIRALLMTHQYRRASRLLGHPYLVCGLVVPGRGVGRQIGFPTTNLKVTKGKVLPKGVFVVKGAVLGRQLKRELWGVCNIGHRPTFLKDAPVAVETHWFYSPVPKKGDVVMLELHHLLRPEKKFRHVEALQRAIYRDIRNAREFVRRRTKNTFISRIK